MTTCWQPTQFFQLLSKAAYTSCRITTNHCRNMLMDTHLILRSLQFNRNWSFHNRKCENIFFHWLDCRRPWLILDHWYIIRLLMLYQTYVLEHSWLRIWVYFTVKPFGMKVIGLIYENCLMDLVILFFILALNYHLIIIWRNFDCMVLRLWNTNTYNMHQMHRQVYKVW
jgi:hypothetical protein